MDLTQDGEARKRALIRSIREGQASLNRKARRMQEALELGMSVDELATAIGQPIESVARALSGYHVRCASQSIDQAATFDPSVVNVEGASWVLVRRSKIEALWRAVEELRRT